MKDNMHSFLISLELCILSVIILSKRCAAADPKYEACLPTNCCSGPNISFPFHVRTIQESYCGYPGFVISCRNELPILQLSGNEFVVDDIFYHNRSLRVYNAAALTSFGSSCFQRITNTSLPEGKFGYDANVTYINLLFDCKNISEDLLRYEVSCGSFRERDNGTLALYDSNRNLRNALEICEENVLAPVELYGDEGRDEVVDVAEVLRRGFVLNWTASDCSVCEESGGRCGFNESSFLFRCFCPDRPHSRSCKPAESVDEKYEACQPKICGEDPPLTIKYPFFIPDEEKDFCGYPGFQVACKENKTIYHTSRGEYIIRNISYEDHSFRLVNPMVLDKKCIPRLEYFALDRSPFLFDQDFVDLILLYSCNETLPPLLNYTERQTSCEFNKSLPSFAVLDPERKISCEEMPCRYCVAAPVELDGTDLYETLESNIDYEKLLENGFNLRWNGISCGKCEESGGFCGFDDGNGTVCFCPDRPHREHCNDDGKPFNLCNYCYCPSCSMIACCSYLLLQ